MALRIKGKLITQEQIDKACNLSESDILSRVSSVMTNPSKHQMHIFKFFLEQLKAYLEGRPNNLSLMVKAVAGSGKTTTIVAIAHLIPTYINAIFLAFNKSIADELKARLPGHVDAKTLNSLGWGICKRYAEAVSGHRIEFKDFTNQYKVNQLMRKMYDWDDNKAYGADVRWLVGMCQSLGIVPAGLDNVVAANGLDDSDDTFDHILAHYDRRVDGYIRPVVYKMARDVLTKTISIVEQISFDEQKYFPVVLRDEGKRLQPWKKMDIVIIDEVQDVNAVDIELIKLILKKNGMVIGVGDNRQSIYGFRGADTEATNKFKSAFSAKDLPLTISYRCSQSVIDVAREIYPEIEAAPNAPLGSVDDWTDFTAHAFAPDGDDMIICRNNAPIVSFAYKLIAARIPVFMKGRDIGRGLIQVIEKMGATSAPDLATKMHMWQAQQTSIALDNNPDDEAAIQRINDKHESIMIFVRHNADGKVATIIQDIQDLFNTKTKETDDDRLMENAVVLSTIHKAKGLEADRVFFLDAHLLMPEWVSYGGWQEIQEKNLEYVAVTRAKSHLVYIDSKGMK